MTPREYERISLYKARRQARSELRYLAKAGRKLAGKGAHPKKRRR